MSDKAIENIIYYQYYLSHAWTAGCRQTTLTIPRKKAGNARTHTPTQFLFLCVSGCSEDWSYRSCYWSAQQGFRGSDQGCLYSQASEGRVEKGTSCRSRNFVTQSCYRLRDILNDFSSVILCSLLVVLLTIHQEINILLSCLSFEARNKEGKHATQHTDLVCILPFSTGEVQDSYTCTVSHAR